LRYWTLKEAFIKAQGKGLSYPLNQFSVGWNPATGCGALSLPSHEAEASAWFISFLKTEPGYVGALAVEEISPVLQYHRLEEVEELLKIV
jgi:phosphopantetheinyl transferase